MEELYTRRQVVTRGSAAAFGLTVAAALAGCGSSSSASASKPIKAKPDGDLSFFTWASYVHPEVVAGFEHEYGVKVTQTFFPSDDAMAAKLANGLPYDLITTNSSYLPLLIDAGLVRKIDHSQLKHWSNVIPYFRNPPFDPGAVHAMPYGYGPTGIGYFPDKISKMSGTWNDLWNQPEAAGHIYLLEQSRDTIGMSLQRLGHPLTSTNASQVNAAAEQVIKLKPRLAGFTSSGIPVLSNRSAWMTLCWSGDVFQAGANLKNTTEINFQMCKDGIPLASDLQSIGAHAKSPGTALLFMDWLLRPDNSAKNSAFIGFPVGTKTGNAAFAKAVEAYPTLRPVAKESLLNKVQWERAFSGAAQRLWAQAWTRIQAA